MLFDSHLEALTHINRRTPGMLDANRVKRPGVQVLGNVPAEQEAWLTPQHKAPKRGPSKRTNFQFPREHVTGEGIARRAVASVSTSIGSAQVRIDLVVGR